jgi:glycogen(starch) synthase
VVTPWYPAADRPFAGAFVQAMVEATAPGCDMITIYHTDGWRMPDATALEAAAVAHRKLLPRALRPEPTVAGSELWRVPVPDPVPTGGSFAERARHHADWLRVALGGTPLPAAVVHAHVGLRGGWTALENARQGARVFVTEHASYLAGLLDQPDSRDLYEQVLARCTGLFAVGTAVRDTLARTFPEYADKIDLVPNPVSFDQSRPRPVTELRRWLYVGNLTEHKGVHLLLEAFATCRAEDPGLTLTLVGAGKLADSLRHRTAALDLDEAVTLAGALPPDQTLRLMRDHDLLVHPSRGETFGVSIVEAVAAGLPVLVTRCGGPETTLAGVEDAAGQMIAVDDAPETIAAGYRRLRERFPEGLDLAGARRVLDERYGYQMVAEAHHRHWFQETAAAGRRQA